jgi:RHS repeat-associated protein
VNYAQLIAYSGWCSTALEYVGESSRLDHVDYPNGMLVNFNYLAGNSDRLVSQIQNLSAPTMPPLPTRDLISEFNYTYNADRTIRTWTIQQGEPSPTTWKFDYDDDRQLAAAERRDALDQVLEQHLYNYDRARNRIEASTSSVSYSTFATNGLNQLRSERGFGTTLFAGTVDEAALVTVNGVSAKVSGPNAGGAYRFESVIPLPDGTSTVTIAATDGSGNIRTQTYQLTTTATATVYEYDTNGNLRFEREPNGAVRREFRWDQADRLLEIIVGSHESEFEYDGNSRRVRSKEFENGALVRDISLLWCGSKICQERSGVTVQRNYFGTGFTASGPRFYTRDALGSIWDVVGENGVSVHARVRYSPWGESVQVSGTGDKSDFGFTGHYYDASQGLVIAQFRAFDPVTGRWLSRDPLGPLDGPNLYVYAQNDPTSLVDPDGLFVAPPVSAAPLFGPAAPYVLAGAVIVAVLVYYLYQDEEGDAGSDVVLPEGAGGDGGDANVEAGPADSGSDDDPSSGSGDRRRPRGNTPGNNRAQNQQFNDALREVERRCGRSLSEDERRRCHEEISQCGYGYHEIIEECVALLGCD